MSNYMDMLDKSKKDYVPQASPNQIRDFIGSTIHKDFISEIHTRIEQMRDYYEDCSSKEYLETRGGIKLLRLFEDVFQNLLDNSIAELESTTEENEDD